MITQVKTFQLWGALFRPQRLLRRFGVFALAMLIGGMALIGAWLTKEIQNGVVEHTTLATAVYIERFIHPLIHDLETEDSLSQSSIDRLTNLTTHGLIQKHVASIKVWRPDGTVVFSSNRSIIGQKFDLEPALLSAVNGHYSTEYGQLESPENVFERLLGKRLVEVYVPMLASETGKVFAVAEFYIDLNALPDDLNFRYLKTWLVVGLLILAMLIPLFLIVRRGDRTIADQEIAIGKRIDELSNLLLENRKLNARVANANRVSSSANERFLNRLGADLHDGPVQMLAAAALNLDGIKKKASLSDKDHADNAKSIARTRCIISEVLIEVRAIATDLVLPELAARNLEETLILIVNLSQMRLKTTVKLEMKDLPNVVFVQLNEAIYRFVQEGLNNSSQHAGGRGQKVSASVADHILTVEVADTGKGFDAVKAQNLPLHLGLSGIRRRIMGVGGTFKIVSHLGRGTVLTATIPLLTIFNHSEKT